MKLLENLKFWWDVAQLPVCLIVVFGVTILIQKDAIPVVLQISVTQTTLQTKDRCFQWHLKWSTFSFYYTCIQIRFRKLFYFSLSFYSSFKTWPFRSMKSRGWSLYSWESEGISDILLIWFIDMVGITLLDFDIIYNCILFLFPCWSTNNLIDALLDITCYTDCLSHYKWTTGIWTLFV